MQRIDVAAQFFLDHLDVVDHAVVGALGQRQDTRRLVQRFACERIGFDLALDVLGLELFQRDRTDDAQMVAGRPQEHGNRASHRDGVQNRLVAVAIDQHDVVGGHVGMPHDFVRGGRAVGYEEAVIGVENARGIQLRLGHRAGMVQQLAQFVDRVADVGAQHVLAEELVEHLAHRALQERHAARVPRAVPRIRAVLRVVDQRLEERRRQ